jgi:hypothetical protein
MFATHHRTELDVKITSVNDRDQVMGRNIVSPRVADIRRRLVDAGAFGEYASLKEQALRYKMAIYVRGHQAASRLASLFMNGFLVIYFAPPHEHFDVPGCNTWLHEHLHSYDAWKSDAQQAAVPAAATPESSVSKLLSTLGTRKRARNTRTQLQLDASLDIRIPGVVQPVFADAPQPEPHHIICRCASFEEMVRCVRFMQTRDDIAKKVAAQGFERIRRLVAKDAMASMIRNALTESASDHAVWDETTHTLFGITNIDYVSKGLLRRVR